MTKLPWLPFYGRDFFNDEQVKLLTLRQIGIYMVMLWHQWEHGSIPDRVSCGCWPILAYDRLDDYLKGQEKSPGSMFEVTSQDTSSRLAENDITDEWTTLEWDIKVAHQFFNPLKTEKGRFVNPRLELIRNEQLAVKQRQSEGGKRNRSHRSNFKDTSRSLAGKIEVTPIKKEIELESSSLSSPNKNSSKKEKGLPALKVVDDQTWLAELKANPVYAGLDIDLEFRKATAWWQAKGKALTRRGFINWLIKAMGDKPMANGSLGTCKASVKKSGAKFFSTCGGMLFMTAEGKLAAYCGMCLTSRAHVRKVQEETAHE